MATVGVDCNIRLSSFNVNLGEAFGFFIKPDSFRTWLPKVWYMGTNVKTPIPTSPLAAGKRVFEFVVLCRGGLVDANGVPVTYSATDYHDKIRAYAARVNETVTLDDPEGDSYTVAIEEMEDRWSPLGGQFLLEWETRIVAVEK